uniref:Coiled-coil domain containing 169 n=1 Tax=Cynoglossus semilaevis TaxID=244447 RepID=A0A3P8W0M4_CYNSE
MLDESVSDLRSTMCELQDRLHSVDGEGSEWKTRYETQVELNGQLDRQISLINERLGDLRGNPIDRLASIRSYDDMPPGAAFKVSDKTTRQEKKNMIPDFVSFKYQAFHKTNDERRAYLSEIAKVSVHFCPQRGEAAGRGVHVKGGATEKRNEEKSPKGSRLPSLKHYNEHSL